jgi:hypothetical protein
MVASLDPNQPMPGSWAKAMPPLCQCFSPTPEQKAHARHQRSSRPSRSSPTVPVPAEGATAASTNDVAP